MYILYFICINRFNYKCIWFRDDFSWNGFDVLKCGFNNFNNDVFDVWYS